MNKKGFTLVELLAVIAILSILVLIALPNTMKLFNDSKQNSFTVEVKKIYDTAKQEWMKDSIEHTSEIVYARVSGSTCAKSLKLSGREEINYYIKLDKNGNVIEYYAEDGTYQYSYNGTGLKIEDINNIVQISLISDSDKVIISCNSASGGLNDDNTISIATFERRQVQGELTVGDELIIANDHFYVVNSNDSETFLLSKYDLNINTNSQVTSNQTKTRFANNGYWDEANCIYKNKNWVCGSNSVLLSPYSDDGKVYCESMNGKNCAYIYDYNSLLYVSVNKYASKLSEITGQNISGRLMTLDEARTMKSSNSAGSKAVKDQNGHTYWLGTVYGKRFIWNVDSSGVISGNFYTNTYSVRPLIVVSTSLIKTGASTNNNEENSLSGTNISEFVRRQVENTISKGDELKIANENFYVVSSNSSETVLLTKYDLNINLNSQVTTNNTLMTFSNEGYWDGLQCVFKDSTWKCLGDPEGLLSPYSDGEKVYCEKSYLSNCAYVYDSNSNLITSINEYADKIHNLTGANVSGRLMTLDEAVRLANENQICLDALKDPNGQKYWLGTAYGKRFIWNVDYSGNITGYYFNNKYGIRPVIVVPTSAL